ncbi:hypothetical protein E2562_020275 [Oryza meyeriana var. granulata]|uniref:Uncharacterized protein n=1 Tax=Oryza meyeriana var. granulata TaxID=110450 RepID=A0A6G1DM23_9ORYZ|nr:hypothetical protein E2562_020275 [Oryza meyeriana var. granulata]
MEGGEELHIERGSLVDIKGNNPPTSYPVARAFYPAATPLHDVSAPFAPSPTGLLAGSGQEAARQPKPFPVVCPPPLILPIKLPAKRGEKLRQ